MESELMNDVEIAVEPRSMYRGCVAYYLISWQGLSGVTLYHNGV